MRRSLSVLQCFPRQQFERCATVGAFMTIITKSGAWVCAIMFALIGYEWGSPTPVRVSAPATMWSRVFPIGVGQLCECGWCYLTTVVLPCDVVSKIVA